MTPPSDHQHSPTNPNLLPASGPNNHSNTNENTNIRENDSQPEPANDHQNEAPPNVGENANEGPEQPDLDASRSRPTAADFSFFDRLLDTALGRNTENPETNTENPTETPNDDMNGSATASAATNDGAGAIIITVNYMFMDGTDNGGPGRSGSLVVTLPNNATNREPNTIHLFISLATGMAYSALVSNAHKNRGVSLKKFQSFPVKPLEDISEQTCSICFEQYENPVKPECLEHECVTKKRKTGEREETPSATADNEREEERRTLENCQIDWKHVPVQLPCGHVFGQACLAHWLKDNHSCPLCRVSLADEQEQEGSNEENQNRFPPVSYFRFGNFDAQNDNHNDDHRDADPGAPEGPRAEAGTEGSGNPEAENTNGSAGDNADGNSGNSGNPANSGSGNSDSGNSGRRLPGLLHRATSVIFNPHHHRRSPPPPPFDAQPRQSDRRRNSPVSPMINQILGLFGRSRRHRDRAGSRDSGSSLFASGVSSRRTADGVETTTNEMGEHPPWADHDNPASRDEPSS